MGQAHRAPEGTYVRQYQIAAHAVGRFRERIGDTASATYRDDEDLANRIDSAIVAAVATGSVEEIIDDGEPTKLINLTQTLDDTLFALIKSNKRSGPKEVVLTLLTAEMVETNRNSHKWVRPGLGTLADVAKVDLTRVVRPMKTACPVVPAALERRMITYYSVDGKGPQCVQYEKALIAEKIAELRHDPLVRADSVELWKPVVFKAREVIDLEE
jgi:hypothetical protein